MEPEVRKSVTHGGVYPRRMKTKSHALHKKAQTKITLREPSLSSLHNAFPTHHSNTGMNISKLSFHELLTLLLLHITIFNDLY